MGCMQWCVYPWVGARDGDLAAEAPLRVQVANELNSRTERVKVISRDEADGSVQVQVMCRPPGADIEVTLVDTIADCHERHRRSA